MFVSSLVSSSLTSNARRACGVALTGLALLALSACGGGNQVQKFKPTALVAFGDESSMLATVAVAVSPGASDPGSADPSQVNTDGTALVGLKTGINTLVTALPVVRGLGAGDTVNVNILKAPATASVTDIVVPGTGKTVLRRVFNQEVPVTNGGVTTNKPLDVQYDYLYNCASQAIWVQSLAFNLGLGFKGQGCDLESGTGAKSHATQGAKVSDVLAQMQVHAAELNGGTLVTVFAGQNDVLALYDQFLKGSLTADQASAAAQSSGRQLAGGVNALLSRGARFLVVTLPVLGSSPRALAPGGNPAVMNALVLAFNRGLAGQGGLKNDGTRIGQVQLYEDTRLVFTNSASLSAAGFSDATNPACNPAVAGVDGMVRASPGAPLFGGDVLLLCHENTLVPGATATNHVWSDEVHFSVAIHQRLANLAFSRTVTNPF